MHLNQLKLKTMNNEELSIQNQRIRTKILKLIKLIMEREDEGNVQGKWS